MCCYESHLGSLKMLSCHPIQCELQVQNWTHLNMMKWCSYSVGLPNFEFRLMFLFLKLHIFWHAEHDGSRHISLMTVWIHDTMCPVPFRFALITFDLQAWHIHPWYGEAVHCQSSLKPAILEQQDSTIYTVVGRFWQQVGSLMELIWSLSQVWNILTANQETMAQLTEVIPVHDIIRPSTVTNRSLFT